MCLFYIFHTEYGNGLRILITAIGRIVHTIFVQQFAFLILLFWCGIEKFHLTLFQLVLYTILMTTNCA